LTHIPTGITVDCQDEKSQHKNKARAMRIMLSRVYEHYKKKHDEERGQLRRNQIGTGDRSERIRTYNFPQNRLTDHRINLTVYDLSGIMEGNLDKIVEALVQHHKEECLKAL
jgi:peptide chain release factor 1